MHASRVLSLANGVVGVVRAAAQSIHAIGHGLALATGGESKHTIKQLRRLLSDGKLDLWALFANWLPYVIGARHRLDLQEPAPMSPRHALARLRSAAEAERLRPRLLRHAHEYRCFRHLTAARATKEDHRTDGGRRVLEELGHAPLDLGRRRACGYVRPMLRTSGCALFLLGLLGCGSRDRIEAPADASAAFGASAATHTAAPRATVLLPSLHPVALTPATAADQPFALRDVESGLDVAVRLVGATPSPPTPSESGLVRFARGYRGAHAVSHRRLNEGLEDFIHFATRPDANVVEYELSLGERVAGLRLIDTVVELIDPDGVPRLRMAPPWIATDGSDVRRDVSVEVVDCAVDRNAEMPWNHRPVAPGARRCTVRLTWDRDVSYPATLDPSWVSTGSASIGHNNGATAALPNGDVMLIGGCSLGNNLTAVAEQYSASKGVFAAFRSLPAVRANHTATALADGTVLVVGGNSATTGICFRTSSLQPGALRSNTGGWVATSTPIADRTTHSATLLPSGEVLVAGGGSATGGAVTQAEYYDPVVSNWFTATNNATGHSAGSLVTLTSGQALLAGGYDGSGAVTSVAELYDPAKNAWTTVGNMLHPRAFLSMVAENDGSALVAGGRLSAATPPPYTTEIERFDPTAHTWSKVAALGTARQNMGGILLPNGDTLFLGGTQITSASSYITYTLVDLLTPSLAVQTYPSLLTQRATPGVALFGSAHDRVIVMGGIQVGAVPLSAEVSATTGGLGISCTRDGDCLPTLVCTTGGTCGAPTGVDAGIDATIDAAEAGASDASGDAKSDASTDVGTDAAGATDSGADAAVETGAPNGTSCLTTGTCASGFCVDGVCCDGACASPCLACTSAKKGSGADGVCAPVNAGSPDPKATCVAASASSCGTDGTCDGAGGCRYYVMGTACGSGSSCDGMGSCVAADAGADATDASDASDATDASSDVAAEAASDAASDASTVEASVFDAPVDVVSPDATPKLTAGLAKDCKVDGDCTSGHCSNGVCCDRPCNGPCESCALVTSPGICSDVPVGLDPKRACSPTPCERTCDGTGNCVGAFAGSECSPSQCTSASTGVGPTVCTAVGVGCPAAIAFDCGAYACDPAFGACVDGCKASSDCAPGYECNTDTGRCVSQPPAAGGGCTMSPRSDGASMASIVGVALLAASLRRSRKRASERR